MSNLRTTYGRFRLSRPILTHHEQAKELLLFIAANRTPLFSGVGVVFYKRLGSLPHVSLGTPKLASPQLPISGTAGIASTLVSISDATSPWHDGFHLIDTETWSLTHISQFLSPVLPENDSEIGDYRPNGARHMTAFLVSNLPEIACVGLLTHTGELCIFEHGRKI